MAREKACAVDLLSPKSRFFWYFNSPQFLKLVVRQLFVWCYSSEKLRCSTMRSMSLQSADSNWLYLRDLSSPRLSTMIAKSSSQVYSWNKTCCRSEVPLRLLKSGYKNTPTIQAQHEGLAVGLNSSFSSSVSTHHRIHATGICTQVGLIFMVLGKYAIHGSYGHGFKTSTFSQAPFSGLGNQVTPDFHASEETAFGDPWEKVTWGLLYLPYMNGLNFW